MTKFPAKRQTANPRSRDRGPEDQTVPHDRATPSVAHSICLFGRFVCVCVFLLLVVVLSILHFHYRSAICLVRDGSDPALLILSIRWQAKKKFKGNRSQVTTHGLNIAELLDKRVYPCPFPALPGTTPFADVSNDPPSQRGLLHCLKQVSFYIFWPSFVFCFCSLPMMLHNCAAVEDVFSCLCLRPCDCPVHVCQSVPRARILVVGTHIPEGFYLFILSRKRSLDRVFVCMCVCVCVCLGLMWR